MPYTIEFWPFVLIAALAYFCGCFNGAVIVSKYILRDDVRNHGSGNAGLTNFYRTFGGPLTAVVILTDVLKAVLAVWLATDIINAPAEAVTLAKYWAGLFCLLGHMYPCMFQFKGGKGILSGGAIVLMIDWRIALVAWVGFLVLAVLTRYVSLGSVWAGASFPIATWFLYHDWCSCSWASLWGASPSGSTGGTSTGSSRERRASSPSTTRRNNGEAFFR